MADDEDDAITKLIKNEIRKRKRKKNSNHITTRKCVKNDEEHRLKDINSGKNNKKKLKKGASLDNTYLLTKLKTYEPQEKYNNSYNISVNTEKNNQNKINLINTNNITFDLPLSMNQNEANSNKAVSDDGTFPFSKQSDDEDLTLLLKEIASERKDKKKKAASLDNIYFPTKLKSHEEQINSDIPEKNKSYNISVCTEKKNKNNINVVDTNNIIFKFPSSINENKATVSNPNYVTDSIHSSTESDEKEFSKLLKKILDKKKKINKRKAIKRKINKRKIHEKKKNKIIKVLFSSKKISTEKTQFKLETNNNLNSKIDNITVNIKEKNLINPELVESSSMNRNEIKAHNQNEVVNTTANNILNDSGDEEYNIPLLKSIIKKRTNKKKKENNKVDTKQTISQKESIKHIPQTFNDAIARETISHQESIIPNQHNLNDIRFKECLNNNIGISCYTTNTKNISINNTDFSYYCSICQKSYNFDNTCNFIIHDCAPIIIYC